MATHTLSVLVENKPGVLTRVAALFARRGFNINSLAVGPTEHPAISRITAVVDVEDHPLEQVVKQLNKLVNVLKVVELDNLAGSVQRNLLLVKVAADASNRHQVIQIAKLFRAHIVDVARDTLVIEVTGTDSKLTALLTLLRPYGIRELVKSGTVGIGRGARRITDRALERALE
ncbi:MAG: acetolactate synthase small subunit [Bifidobacteriaceae bacterium]|jgi:acetolactate synthase-1/3 small subunit|nr:acetolactate synthase small subunit [Bifidobacteriaceae bacterium]